MSCFWYALEVLSSSSDDMHQSYGQISLLSLNCGYREIRETGDYRMCLRNTQYVQVDLRLRALCYTDVQSHPGFRHRETCEMRIYSSNCDPHPLDCLQYSHVLSHLPKTRIASGNGANSAMSILSCASRTCHQNNSQDRILSWSRSKRMAISHARLPNDALFLFSRLMSDDVVLERRRLY